MAKPEKTAKIHIGKAAVDALVPTGKRAMYFDDTVPGFGIEVMPSGVKVYRLVYRHHGRARQMTLGQHGAISPAKARKMAEEARGQVASRRDPADEKAAARRAATLRETIGIWQVEHVAAKRSRSTIESYASVIDRLVLPALGSRKLNAIERADVAALHRKLAHAPYVANRVVAVLRSFFTWCERNNLRPQGANPAKLIEFYKEHGRERVLTVDELARLGAALRAAETQGEWPWAIAAIRLIAYTGARKNEVLGLRWEWVDLDTATARLPTSKTGAKTLHFGGPAIEVLRDLARRRSIAVNIVNGRVSDTPRIRKGEAKLSVADNPFVIFGRAVGGGFIGLQAVWDRIRVSAEIEDVRLHDLRHVFASFAVMGGMSLPTVGRLLGHSQPAMTDKYAHFATAPLVQAADTVGSVIASHMGGAQAVAGGLAHVRHRIIRSRREASNGR